LLSTPEDFKTAVLDIVVTLPVGNDYSYSQNFCKASCCPYPKIPHPPAMHYLTLAKLECKMQCLFQPLCYLAQQDTRNFPAPAVPALGDNP
jgi:hypothetical protein